MGWQGEEELLFIWRTPGGRGPQRPHPPLSWVPPLAAAVPSGAMAVPFVEDWDLVQTLGEGAYGE